MRLSRDEHASLTKVTGMANVRMVTRFAPTPSGYLHDGNLVNLLLICWLREQHDGQLALRIDSHDTARQRPEYLQDIFDTLAWLQVQWDIGPQSMAEASDLRDFEIWRKRALDLRDPVNACGPPGLRAFVCQCSRRDLAESRSLACVADCAHSELELVTGASCLRLALPERYRELGQPVLWRRDGIPAYHLASVLTDEELSITHILRGADLLSATQIQLLLAEALGAEHVRQAIYLHHGLVRDAHGNKLSKSTLTQGRAGPKSDERKRALRSLARNIGEPLGITPPSRHS